MNALIVVIGILQILACILAISLGRSIMTWKLRKEENRRRELEREILKSRTHILTHGKKIASDLEDVLYQAKVQQEIDNITRKSDQ